MSKLTSRRWGAVVCCFVLLAQMAMQLVPLQYDVYADEVSQSDLNAFGDAVSDPDFENVKMLLDRAAFMKLVTQKLKACLGLYSKENIFGDLLKTSGDSEDVLSGKVFSDLFLGLTTHTVSVGHFLENGISGDRNTPKDGVVDCQEGGYGRSNGLFMTFYTVLKNSGVVNSPLEIVCDKRSNRHPGILTPASDNAACDAPGDGGFIINAGSLNPTFYDDYSNGWYNYEAYLKFLYDSWTETTPFFVPFEDLGNWNPVDKDGKSLSEEELKEDSDIIATLLNPESILTTGRAGAIEYYLFTREISVFCAGNSAMLPIVEDSKGDAKAQGDETEKEIKERLTFDADWIKAADGAPHYDTPLDWIDIKTGAKVPVLVKAYGPGRNGMVQGPDQNAASKSSEKKGSFGNIIRNCDDLIAAANEIAPYVQEQYRLAKVIMCKSAFEKVEEEMRRKNQLTLEQTQRIDAFHGELNNTGDYTIYLEDSEDGGWNCVDTTEMFGRKLLEGDYHNPEDWLHTGLADCINGGAAGAFGWLICPLIASLATALEGAYGIIEDFLTINPILFTGQGGVLRGAWSSFQALANVMFVIMFIAIIVSQVSGFGIDNYGIKKMLPRLIVVAILVNLSFIICQLAVDISNIVGKNAYAFLQSSADKISISDPALGLTGSIGLVTFMVALLAVVMIAVINPITLLPLLVTLIGGLISVLFMFLLLGVRQAAVALFVVIAPVAFAMNVFPNTAGLFKKWLNIFKVLLLLFPICGLVMGGAYYGSRLLMSVTSGGDLGSGGNLVGLIFGIVAFVLLLAPVFFIPKLTKGAFDGLGKLGATMTGLGGKLSGKATGAVKGSEAYKRAGESLTNAKDTRVANRLGGKADRLAKKGKTLRSGQQQRLARAQAGVLQKEKREAQGRMASQPGRLAAARAGVADAEQAQAVKDQETLVANDNVTDLQTKLESAILGDDTVKIMAYQNALSRKGEAGREAVRNAMVNVEGSASASAKSTFGANIMDNHAADYKANSRSTFNYANMMAEGKGAAAVTMAGSASTVTASQIRPETLANMDDAEFARLGMSVSQDMAREALLNPSLTNMSEGRRSQLERIAAGTTADIRTAQATAGQTPVINAITAQQDTLQIQHEEQLTALRGPNSAGFYDPPDGSYLPTTNIDVVQSTTNGRKFNVKTGRFES